jgi:hypothetical protein
VTRPPIPATLDELLDPSWLSAALGLRFPQVEVERVTLGQIVSRLSTNARFTIECRGERPEGLPAALCVKGYFTDEQRAVGRVGEPEALFYAGIAELTGVRTLLCVYADVDPVSHHGVIITEDVIAAGGTFLDALSPYSVEQTAASLEELARLHARTWGKACPPDDWLVSRIAPPPGSGVAGITSVRGVEHVRGNFEGPVGVDVPDEVRADPQRIIDGLHALGALERTAGVAVIHGDPHICNVFLDASGRPGLVDWQVIQRNHWSIDVAYHVGSALDDAERRRSERDLLSHYLEHVRANGAEAPSEAQAWDDYRSAMVYGVYMWAITLKVDPPIIRRLLQRLTTAAADHDSLGRLGV